MMVCCRLGSWLSLKHLAHSHCAAASRVSRDGVVKADAIVPLMLLAGAANGSIVAREAV